MRNSTLTDPGFKALGTSPPQAFWELREGVGHEELVSSEPPLPLTGRPPDSEDTTRLPGPREEARGLSASVLPGE